jgi:stress response protein SCP2
VDLDSSVVAFGRDGRVVDAAWYRQLQALGGVLRHKGDNTTGVRSVSKT